MKKLTTQNEIQTFALGQKLGADCHGGEVFILNGDLGAGKTKFLQGLAKGLGIKAKVNSPTFNIMKIYKLKGAAAKGGVNAFCHVDAYRLRSSKDLISLGIEEYFNAPGIVTAIEWGDKVKDIWPKKAIIISIKSLAENKREISIKGSI